VLSSQFGTLIVGDRNGNNPGTGTVDLLAAGLVTLIKM